MARTLRYHPLFDCDVREAAGWYDRRSSGLGDVFVQTVSKCVKEIIANPKRFAIGPTGCPYLRLKRFPYIVLFDVNDDELIMLAVLHTARSMEKWRERKPDAE
jgi:hypothetical protein